MAYTIRDFLADQLQAAAPEAEWGAAGVDRADELAGVLQLRGIKDLSKLQLAKVTITKQDHKWTEPYGVDEFVFLYDGRQLGFLGNAGENNTEPYLQKINGAVLASWSSAGHGHVAYLLQPRANGFVIVPSWGSSSDADFVRHAIVFYATFILAFVLPASGIAAGATVGSAIVGAEFAAAYPALTSAIGNAAIGAAMSGGDVQGAVKNAALAYVGGTAGNAVGGLVVDQTQLDLLGKVAASVTQTFVQGGDIQQAAQTALLRNAGELVTIFQPSPGVPQMDFTFDNPLLPFGSAAPVDLSFGGGDLAFTNPGGFLSPDFSQFNFGIQPLDLSFPDFTPNVSLTGEVFSTTQAPASYMEPSLVYSDAPTTYNEAVIGGGSAIVEAPRAMPQSDGFGWSDARNLVNSVSQMALAALSVNRAYNQARAPAVNTAARVVNNGAVTSTLDNGVIMSRDANGKVTVTRPPVGVPQSTVNGNLVVNNGDGTYTLIDPQGNRRVIRYGAETTSNPSPLSGFNLANVNWPVVTGVLGVAVLLMKASRK